MKLMQFGSAIMLVVAGSLQAQEVAPKPSSLGELTRQQAAKFKGISPEQAKLVFEEAIKAVSVGSDVAAAGIVAGAIEANPDRIAEIVESATRLQPMFAPVAVATAVGSHPDQATKVVVAARAGVRQSPVGQVEVPKAGNEAKAVVAGSEKVKVTMASLNASIVAASKVASSKGEVSRWLWGVPGRPSAVVRPIDALNLVAAGIHAVEGEEGGGAPIDPGGGGEEGGGQPTDPSESNNTPPPP
jgi:hypothetical protein